jgi:hypothetical protein
VSCPNCPDGYDCTVGKYYTLEIQLADRRHAGLALPCELCAGPCRIDDRDETGTRPKRTEVIHAIADGSAVTSCCGKTPFELPAASHRLTQNPEQVTCPAPLSDDGFDGGAR